MICLARKQRPPFKRHGGKAYLARRIIECLPVHRIYTEPFVGAGSVLLNKPRAAVEVAGDIDADLIHFWNTLVERPGRLREEADQIAYSEAVFRRFLSMRPTDDDTSPTVRALRTLVVSRFSRGGLGRDFAWSERLRGGKPGDANAWDKIRAELPAIAERVRDVEFRRCDALGLIREFDGPDTLHYCDPPYLPSTRTTRDAYDHEMTEADHAALLATLERCRGAVALSGYPSPLYDDALAGWERVEFSMPNHSGQGRTKQRRVEVLWLKGSASD